jgi:hemerythrin-like domain-containing protein
MTVTDQLPRPDVTEMVVIHNTLRDVLAAAPQIVGSARPDDPSRVAMVASFYENVLNFLAVHHSGEDALVFPKLMQRCPADAERVAEIAGQHHDVDDAVAAATSSLAAWAGGDAAAQISVAVALADLGATLRSHLADEEREVLPLCEVTMTVAEWGELPGHAMRAYSGDKVWLILGLIRQRMTPLQRDTMLANMPPPLVEMWNTVGESAFNGLMTEIGPPLG